MQQLTKLPKNLPQPEDDGACDHLLGIRLSPVDLQTTNNETINFENMSGRIVIYIYPMTGRPDTALPDGWDEIPGARGCTPQSCSFRDHHSELESLNVSVYGLSTQNTQYQKEAVSRLHLPFPLVSDESLFFIKSLSLPTIEVEGMVLSKRITLILDNGKIEKVFYPVFPPNDNANQVIEYLNDKKA